MRWLLFIWGVTLIGIPVLANDRSKRTLPFIDIASSILGVQPPPPLLEEVHLYKLPGYDNLLLKATPKINVEPVSEVMISNNTQRVISSYPQNAKCDDKVNSFNILSLLKRGILKKKQFLKKILAPRTPISPFVIIRDQVKYPVIKEVKNKDPVLKIKYTKTTEVDTNAIAVPVQKVSTARKQVKISEVVQPKYSYKQASKDGTVMTYDFEDNPNVIVTEIEAMPALPKYIKSRFENVVSAVRHPVVVAPGGIPFPGAIIAENIRFGPPIIPGDIGNIITPLPPVIPPIIPPAFARLQDMGYFEGGNYYGPPIIVEEDIPVLLRTQTKIIKTPGPKGDVNVKITKNDKTVLNNKLSPGASPSRTIPGGNNNFGVNFVGNLKSLPPPPLLSDIKLNSPTTNYKVSAVQQGLSESRAINGQSDVSSNIASNEHGSSFTYKQINTKSLQSLDMSQATYNQNTNSGNTNRIYYISDKPVNSNIELSRTKIQIANADGFKPCRDSNQVTKSSNCPEPFYNNYANLKSSPIVVSDSTPFIYKQMNAGGSAISTIGSNNNVIVDVKERTQVNRGDIPETGVYK